MPYGSSGGYDFGTSYGTPTRPGGGYSYLTGGGGAGPANHYSTTDSSWSQVNDPKTSQYGTTYFNAATGETYFQKNEQPGRAPSPGSTLNTYPNHGGGGGGGGYAVPGAPDLPEFSAWGGSSFDAPAGWVPPDTGIPEAGVDTRAIVESRRHMLDEEMSGQMSDSARRMGAGGMLAGSEYINELGQAERSRDKDLASLYYEYDERAAQQDANRKAAARENMLSRDLDAWGTHGGWEQEANMFGSGQDFQAWMAENAFNQQNYGNELDYMNTTMPLLLANGAGGGGGGGYGWNGQGSGLQDPYANMNSNGAFGGGGGRGEWERLG